MSNARILVALGLLGASFPAVAAPDLSTSISAASGVYVYASGRYTVTVSNAGPHNASSASVVIQLPETHTSPTVHVMGVVDGKSSSCTQSGTALTCALGSIRKGRSASVHVDLTLPESAAPLQIVATASTSGETHTANNTATHTAALVNPLQPVGAPRTADVRLCTGTDLTSFFECELYPSSLSGFTLELAADGSLTVPEGGPTYGGDWGQDGDANLWFVIEEFGAPVAEFDGYGVGGDCFEGITTFPGDPTYVSPYEVCLR